MLQILAKYISPLACLFASLAVATADPNSPKPVLAPAASEFRFARMIYVDQAGAGFNRGWWQQDYPEAEDHFTFNLKRLTRISVDGRESVAVPLTDDRLFEYPWLYATQTGFWDLSDEEVGRLREYLLRGGFLMCDDFWDVNEFQVFAATMARVFPDREMVELHDDDAVLHVVFSIDEAVQIPGLRHLGRFGQMRDLPPPYWLGIYDDSGRLMVGINYNQDVGDSWEEADTPGYPEAMTAQGYRFGVNYVTYAMTH
jgi:hypothetical protein